MEYLSVLEKKVIDLIELVKLLKSENLCLKEKIESLEAALLKDKDVKDDLDQEKELTKLVVDGLIQSIDSAVEGNHQQ